MKKFFVALFLVCSFNAPVFAQSIDQLAYANAMMEDDSTPVKKEVKPQPKSKQSEKSDKLFGIILLIGLSSPAMFLGVFLYKEKKKEKAFIEKRDEYQKEQNIRNMIKRMKVESQEEIKKDSSLSNKILIPFFGALFLHMLNSKNK